MPCIVISKGTDTGCLCRYFRSRLRDPCKGRWTSGSDRKSGSQCRWTAQTGTKDRGSGIFYYNRRNRKNGEFVVREQNGKYEDTGFVNISSDYIYVRSATSDDSDWTGKLYPGNAVTLKGPVGEWTAVQSGNITGFIRSEYLMDAGQAQQKVRQMEAEALKNGTEVTFSYGETKEEEAARLQAEAEQRAREEAERKQAQRQAVVDYACQFIGNPYVWGGTSLTNGADCSGFVQSVYAHLAFPFRGHPRLREAQDTRSPILRHSREISSVIMVTSESMWETVRLSTHRILHMGLEFHPQHTRVFWQCAGFSKQARREKSRISKMHKFVINCKKWKIRPKSFSTLKLWKRVK